MANIFFLAYLMFMRSRALSLASLMLAMASDAFATQMWCLTMHAEQGQIEQEKQTGTQQPAPIVERKRKPQQEGGRVEDPDPPQL